MDLKQVISKKDKTIEKLRREVRSKISLVKEIQVKLLTLEKSSKKSNMQLRENIEDLQDENRKLMRETLDFINKIHIFEYLLFKSSRNVEGSLVSRRKYDKYHIFPRLTRSLL